MMRVGGLRKAGYATLGDSVSAATLRFRRLEMVMAVVVVQWW